jgi:ArsR family metal-binding transcriptional regulator
MEPLITKFTFELAETACAPGSGRYGIKIDLPQDISPVFPYLNGVMKDTWYDHDGKILIGTDRGRRYALRATEIRVTGVEEASQAPEFVHQAIDMVNKVWQERETITPRFTERSLPAVIDIFKLLPKTNCKQCGFPTCLVFASELHSGKVVPEQCPPLSETANLNRKESIRRLFST